VFFAEQEERRQSCCDGEIDRERGEFSTMSVMAPLGLLLLSVIWLLPSVSAFYLPGVAPRDFKKGDDLQVKVNKLTSTKTQLPYAYYSLDYCKPTKIINSAENLGEVLRGDIIENSPYVVSFQDNCLRPVGIFY
jgi:transmembrane 9 superfamily protein 2/4